jgi:hypothetical protein
MTGRVYHVDVDRVVLVGAGKLDAHELRGLIEASFRRELVGASLPDGRTMRAAVRVSVRSLKGGAPAIAGAVATGFARAISGGATRG